MGVNDTWEEENDEGSCDELVTRFPNCNSTLSTPTEQNTLLENTLLTNMLLKYTLQRL